MKNAVLLVALFCLNFFPGAAQVPANYNADNESIGRQPLAQFVFQQNNSNRKAVPETQTIKGSPFVVEAFLKGAIYSSDGFEGDGYFRYDGYNDEVQFKIQISDTTIVKLIKQQDIYCKIGNDRVDFREFFNKKKELVKGHLFRLVETEDAILYERRLKKYKEGKEAVTSFELPVPSRFVAQKEYYYFDKDEKQISYLSPTKKGIMALFKNDDKAKQKKMKSFVSNSRLDLKQSKDMVQVFYYYNNL